MSNRMFIGLLAILLGGTVVLFASNHKHAQLQALVGVATHSSQGNRHIAEGSKHTAYNSDLPSSGSHYQDAYSPAQWGSYTQELPPEIFLHNEEHGGIVIAYKPNLASDLVEKLKKLFATPSLDKNFSAGKFILMPRVANKQPIELASWTRTYDLNSFDETKIEEFYRQNVGNKRAPESRAGPTNKPINQVSQ